MGLLDGTTQQEYYQGSDHGNYQFTSLNDVINQFIVAYVGEDKIISKIKQGDVAFHAQRAMQELSFDTFKSCKAQEITVPASLQMILPQDYVNYTKISWVDSAGIKHRECFFAPRERTQTALYSVALRPLLLPFRFLLPLLRLLLLLAFPSLEFRRGHPHSVARLLGQRLRQPQHLSRTRVSLGRRVAHLCVRQVCDKCATSVSLLESAGSRRTHHALQRRPHGQRRAAVFPRELRRRQHPLLGEAQMIGTSSLW